MNLAKDDVFLLVTQAYSDKSRTYDLPINAFIYDNLFTK